MLMKSFNSKMYEDIKCMPGRKADAFSIRFNVCIREDD